MAQVEYPVTAAVRVLRARQVPFEPLLYTYEEHGGTALSAAALGIPEHAVVKTLVMETETHKPLIVLMHGDREVSTKNLARTIGVKSIQPSSAQAAQKHTGYLFGGTSPFGTRTPIPTYAEKSIFEIEKIYINGGKRGFLVAMRSADLKLILTITEVEVALPKITS